MQAFTVKCKRDVPLPNKKNQTNRQTKKQKQKNKQIKTKTNKQAKKTTK